MKFSYKIVKRLSYKIVKRLWAWTFLFLVFLLPLLAQAQANTATRYKWLTFLNGYNVVVPTNLVAVGPLSTNVEFTTYKGQNIFSYTNTGFTSSNIDAFQQFVQLQADRAGDIQSNVTLWVVYGVTNWFPLTNSSGNITNWPLQNPIMGNNGALPGTGNSMPTLTANDTNTLCLSLFRAPFAQPQGDGVDGAIVQPQWETTAGYTNLISMSAPVGGAGYSQSFVLPMTFLNGAAYVKCTLYSTNTAHNSANGSVVSAIGILQPQQ